MCISASQYPVSDSIVYSLVSTIAGRSFRPPGTHCLVCLFVPVYSTRKTKFYTYHRSVSLARILIALLSEEDEFTHDVRSRWAIHRVASLSAEGIDAGEKLSERLVPSHPFGRIMRLSSSADVPERIASAMSRLTGRSIGPAKLMVAVPAGDRVST